MSTHPNNIVNSIHANGYSINKNGGVYRRGKSKPFESIAFTASKFFELQQQLQPGGEVSLRALAKAARCSTTIARKVIDQIEEGHLIDPSIHRYQESDGMEEYLWNYHGIFLQFLPTRSPELNPIELLWNILAQRLKHLPIGREGPCTNRVAHAAVMLMNAFTHDDVDGCFKKCGYIECVIS